MSHPLIFIGQSSVNIEGAGRYILPTVGGDYKVTWQREWLDNLLQGNTWDK